MVTAYATWDFKGRAGAARAGRPGLHRRRQHAPRPMSRPGGHGQTLQALDAPAASPWLAFGGIAAPYAGIFVATGSAAALLDPNAPSLGSNVGPPPRRHRAPGPGHQPAASSATHSTRPRRRSACWRPRPTSAPVSTTSGAAPGLERRRCPHPHQAFRHHVLRLSARRASTGSEWYFPPAAHRRLRGGGQRQRQSGPEGPRRRRHHGPRAAEGSAHLRLRGPPRGPAVLADARILARQSHIPTSQPDPRQPPEHLLPQRSGRRPSPQRLLRPPPAIPGKDRPRPLSRPSTSRPGR